MYKHISYGFWNGWQNSAVRGTIYKVLLAERMTATVILLTKHGSLFWDCISMRDLLLWSTQKRFNMSSPTSLDQLSENRHNESFLFHQWKKPDSVYIYSADWLNPSFSVYIAPSGCKDIEGSVMRQLITTAIDKMDGLNCHKDLYHRSFMSEQLQ